MGLVRGELFVDPKTGEFAEEGVTSGTAMRVLLKKVDIEDQIKSWTDKAKNAKGEKGLDDANKHLKYLHALKKLGVRPEDAYIQTKIPVLPPKFRPIAELEEGKLSNPGINTLYRDVGLISNELKWQNSAPFIDDGIKAELRQKLFEGVEAVTGLGNPIAYYPEARRPKGIIQQLKGPPAKKGFFQYKVLRRQQNLVGRGTIIPEPKLGLDEVGLPAEMSWSIFEPFVMRRLVNQSGMSPVQASEEIKKRSPVAMSMLEAEMKSRPVMLNRAPSLHKFGIMAFKPKLTDGKAIKIPPLVVKGFNADFDGDTMTVHVPILPDAVKEAEKMLPSNNLYNPGTGQIMIKPQNEAALGLYLLSKDTAGKKKLQSVLPKKTAAKYSGTVLDKKNLSSLMKDLAEELPQHHGGVIDKLKEMGDEHTYRIGFTVGLKDLTPNIEGRNAIFADVQKKLSLLDTQTPGGRSKSVDLVAKANKRLDSAVARSLAKTPNNFSLMVDSGARGNMNQLKQIVSAPFMVDDHKGNPNPVPILNSFSEGLPFSSYWSTVYGARAAAVDKQLQTANPGAFNKDLMAASVTNVIASDDCGTTEGLTMRLFDKSGKFRPQDIEDRYLAKDVKLGGKVLASAGSPVTSSLLNLIRDKKVGDVSVRSPLTCKLPKGTCAKCYGLNEHGQNPSPGDNVGATSGQALSEPLTQMTMQTFHTGGISGTRGVVSGYEKIDKLFKMHKIVSGKAALSEVNGKVESIEDKTGGKSVVIGGKTHFIEKNLWDSKKVRIGGRVSKGDILSRGLVQPKELVKLRGMLEAQNYVAGQIQDAYEGQGVTLKRRAVETVIRSVGNTTKISDPGDSDYLYGEVAPWTAVNDFNDKVLGKMPVSKALGHAIKESIAGLKPGDIIDEKATVMLGRAGRDSVEVGNKPIRHEAFLSGIQRIPVLRDDWMGQMGYRDIADALVGGAATLSESDLHGYSPVPAFAYGAEFGVAPIGKKGTGVY
jgi:DNA-directed RNA polymerase subunit beta'